MSTTITIKLENGDEYDTLRNELREQSDRLTAEAKAIQADESRTPSQRSDQRKLVERAGRIEDLLARRL